MFVGRYKVDGRNERSRVAAKRWMPDRPTDVAGDELLWASIEY